MKILLQAFIGSIILHVMYIVCTMFAGFIKTKFYQPDISSAWEKVGTLQNEVSFGMVTSPFFHINTLVGVAVICGIILFSYKKLFNKDSIS